MNIHGDILIEKREKRRLLMVFSIATLLLIGIGIVLFNQYQRLVIKPVGVRDTYDVLLQTRELFSSLQDLQTGQRGYLLTGDKQFLEPFETADQHIDAQLDELRNKVADNPQRLRQLDELTTVIRQHRKLLLEQIRDHEKKRDDRVLTTSEAETGKAIMDHARSVITRMVEDEKVILTQRVEKSESNRATYARLLLAGVLTSLLALIVTNGIIVQTSMRRRSIELALQRSRELSSIVVESSPDCIKLLDLKGNILSVNQGGTMLMEMDDASLFIDKSWLGFWQGPHQTLARRAFEDSKLGRYSRFEGQCPTAKGRMRWWEVILTPIRGSDSEIEHILVISRDITLRYEADQKLREDEARFRQMADTLPQMIWTALPNGFRDYFNRRWYDTTGLSEADSDGQGWLRAAHPEDQPKLAEHWRHSVATGEPYEIEYRLRRADGVYCWTLGRALPMRDDNGTVVRWYGTSTVIEDQKRVEAQLREARDAAEAANQSKSEFLANMSHEIRTPMNAVVGLANLLSSSRLTDEKRAEFVKTIQLSAQQLMELINDLLDISKIENAQVELEKIPFNLGELLEEIRSVMSVRAKERQVDLVVNYAPVLDGMFIGDPLRIRQILMNLVSNAVKFTQRGTVTIQAEPAVKKAGEPWDIRFDVIDTGIGIHASKLETIFSKFSQADTSITRKYGGTGLGLSICKSLVGLMGGHIGVVSTEGLGSKFTVHIPLVPSDDKTPKQAKSTGQRSLVAAQPLAATQPLVLLVEDYKANVLVATQTIEDCGFAWELAEDGAEAIAKVKAGRYAAVLMDVQMPNMDGISATQHIRAWEMQEGRSRTPIIGITAYSTESDRDKCLEVGMDDYLSKPFNPETLKEKLRSLSQEPA